MIKSFQEIIETVKGASRKRIAVAMAQDDEILLAVQKAKQEGLAEAILIGDRKQIQFLAEKAGLSSERLTIEHVEGEEEAVRKAVSIVREGKAEVLMKGKCSTATYLKTVLDKEIGLRADGVLSHLAAFEVSSYPKLILMSDAAMNIYPDLQTKISITRNAIMVAHKLGIAAPKVALISAIEKVNHEAMPCTADAAVISKMAQRGQINNAIVDGPLAVDNALSKKSCEVKGIKSTVGGDTDILIMPNIETGNCFYKVLNYLAGAKCAGIIIGAKVPMVLTSRADTDTTKFLSIAFAMLIS